MQEATMRETAMRETAMKASIGLLTLFLLVTTMAATTPVGANEDTLSARERSGGPGDQPAIRLAAAGGHDSVGGLMPLPLWPPYAVRGQDLGPARASRHRSRKCTNLPCPRPSH
jgi:hypothetical protein